MLTFPGPTIIAAFLASLVGFVEALTIVLAVGAVRGWRPALAGAAGLLAVLVLAFGPRLASLDAHLFQLVVGVLLLLFGLRWLRKAILRAAGVIALHNEEKEYAETEAALRGSSAGAGIGMALARAMRAKNLDGRARHEPSPKRPGRVDRPVRG